MESTRYIGLSVKRFMSSTRRPSTSPSPSVSTHPNNAFSSTLTTNQSPRQHSLTTGPLHPNPAWTNHPANQPPVDKIVSSSSCRGILSTRAKRFRYSSHHNSHSWDLDSWVGSGVEILLASTRLVTHPALFRLLRCQHSRQL